MKVIAFLLLLCGAVVGQSSSDLQQKYGPPTSQTFNARHGIDLTVNYDDNGRVVEMSFGPRANDDPDKADRPLMKSALVYGLLDELAPEAVRGKLVMATFLNITCLPDDNCHGVMEEYKNLTVHRMGNDNAFTVVTIRWKHPLKPLAPAKPPSNPRRDSSN